MSSAIALVTMIVEPADEGLARALAGDVLAQAGLAAADVRWSPYDKLGPNSRVSALAQLASGGPPEAVVDAVLAVVLKNPEDGPSGYENRFEEGDALFFNRIFDARTTDFSIPGLLWLDIELDTQPDRQRELARLFALG